MENKKNYTTETNAMKKNRINALKKFNKEIKELGFRKMTTDEILNNNKRLGLEFPDRVNNETHLQDQYIYAHKNGYQVVVITSILNDHFMKNGRVWIHITQDERRVWSRYFMKIGYHATLEKVVAYAELARNVVNMRPQCPKSDAWMDLENNIRKFYYKGKLKTHFVYTWTSDYTLYSFEQFWKFYMQGISNKRSNIIFEKEAAMDYYFKVRTAKQFSRDIRKKVIVSRPENSVAKK